MTPSRRLLAPLIAVAVVVTAAAAIARQPGPTLGLALRAAAGLAGYEIRWESGDLGWSHADLHGLRVRVHGEPLFAARRVVADYEPRDLLPGGKRAGGLASLDLEAPEITLVRHADGSFNVGRPAAGGGATGTAPPRPGGGGPPWRFTARVRDGVILLVDRAPAAPDLAEQRLTRLDADAAVATDARTTYRIDAVWLGRASARGRAGRWPLHARGTLDAARGYAAHRLRAAEFPLRGVLAFAVHSPALHFEDGELKDLDVRAFALADGYHLGGGADLDGIAIRFAPLARPLSDVHGRIDLYDGGVTTRRVDAELAGLPLRARGGLYGFGDPRLRIAVAGEGDLARLRAASSVTADRPVSGPIAVEALITGRAADPLVRADIRIPRLTYAGVPVDGVAGTIDFANDRISIDGLRAQYGGLHAAVDGMAVLGGTDTTMGFFVRAGGAAAGVPYLQRIASREVVGMAAAIDGTAAHGFHAGGTLWAEGPGGTGAGVVAVDELGRGDFGPFTFVRPDGASFQCAFRLDRTRSLGAAWLDVRGFRVDLPGHVAGLPGVTLPSFPPIGGVLDVDLVGGGAPDGFAVAGNFHATDARFDRYALGTVEAGLAGTLGDLRLTRIGVDGPLGRFAGSGASRDGRFALKGTYDGELADLTPVTGHIGARGAVVAPVAVLLDGPRLIVQTEDAVMHGASVRGVALERASGTLAFAVKGVDVIAADARLAGRRAVAATSAKDRSEAAVSVVDLPARAMRGAGIPLDAGRLSLFGIADLRGPTFRGTVDLTGGRAVGFPVRGWADLDFRGTRLSIAEGSAAFGSTYGNVAGEVDLLDPRAPSYRLEVGVPVGDVGTLVRELKLPLRTAAGTYAAQVVLTGTGTAPRAEGSVEVPEGAFHGLGFRAAGGRLTFRPDAINVDGGRVTVGSTQARFSAALTGSVVQVAASSDAADLSDFDDFFNASNTLAGRGSMAFSYRGDGKTIVSDGRLRLTGARFRRFPVSDVAGAWRTADGRISLEAAIDGALGHIHATGTVLPAAGDPVAALFGGNYDGDLVAQDVDLGAWLPATGFSFPVLGRVDATGHVSGVWPLIALGGDASLRNGFIGRFPVPSAATHTTVQRDHVEFDAATAELGFATLTGSGTVGLTRTVPLELRVHAAVPDAGAAAARLYPRRPLPVTGTLDVDLGVRGTLAAPRITAGADLEGGSLYGVAVPRALANAETDLHDVKLNSVEVDFPSGSAFAAGVVPISLAPPGVGPANAPLSFTLAAHAIDLAPFGRFVPGGPATLGGTLDGQLAIEGTVAAPQVRGGGTLSKGSFVSAFQTAPIRNVDASVAFNGTSVALQALHAEVGSGALEASGELNLPFPNAPTRGYAIGVRARAAQLNFPAYGGGRLDGAMQIVGGRLRPTLSGDVAVSHARIPFAAIYRAASGSSEEAPGPQFDLGFDLHAHARDDVRIVSPIIDVGATGDVDLSGTLLSPRLFGTFKATRGGIFSTYQRAFRIENATVQFDPAQGIVPSIDLRASAHVSDPDPDPTRNAIGSADITVTATGPADGMTVTYASDPPYSQAQILGLLVDAPLLGAVNFNAAQPGGILPGAPGEFNVLLPPGVTPYQAGSTTFQQEAFSLLNTQLTQRFIAPAERFFEGVLGLTDLEMTLDYGGRLGYSARRLLVGRTNLAVSFGQVLSEPLRTQVGFEMRPDGATTASLSFYTQTGTPAVLTGTQSAFSTDGVLRGVQQLTNRQGFRFNVTRRYP